MTVNDIIIVFLNCIACWVTIWMNIFHITERKSKGRWVEWATLQITKPIRPTMRTLPNSVLCAHTQNCTHDDVIKWKHFPCYWPFLRGIHRSPVNSPHKDQWREALMFPLIYAWIDAWANDLESGDLRRHRAHYDVIVMIIPANKKTNTKAPLTHWGWEKWP